MAKNPAFNFYSDNFLSGTMFLTDEQAGKYIRLLCAQHQTGHLKENHMKIICKGYDEDIWSKFIADEHGLYFNERLELEINKRTNYSESRSNNKKGKKLDTKIISKSYDDHMGIGIGIEKGIEKEKEKRFLQPTVDMVIGYCNERQNNVDPVKWIDFYESKGWMIGQNKMKDWKAAVRTWEKNNSNTSNGSGKQKQEFSSVSNSGVSDSYKQSILNRLQYSDGE